MKKAIFTISIFCLSVVAFSQTMDSGLTQTGSIDQTIYKDAVVVESSIAGDYEGKAVVGKVNVDNNPGVSAMANYFYPDPAHITPDYDGKAVVGKVNVDNNPGVSASYVVVRIIESGELLSGIAFGEYVSGEVVKVNIDQQKLDSVLNLIR